MFDFKRFEDNQHLTGYVDNDLYLSSICVKNFIYRNSCTFIGTIKDGNFNLTYSAYNHIAHILSGDNRGTGFSFGRQLANTSNGVRVRFRVI